MGDAVLSLDDEEVARALAEQKEMERRPRKESRSATNLYSLNGRAGDIDGNLIPIRPKKEEKQRPIVWPKTTVPPHSETVTKHCWSDPSDRCTSFRVRGPNYLQDKVKIPSKEAPYKTVGLDLIKSETRIENICKRPDNFVQLLHSTYREKSPFIICGNFLLPWGNFVVYWTPRHEGPSPLVGDPKLDQLITNFINGDDNYRNGRWKFIPRMVEGNFIVKRTVGETPALIAKKLTHKYFRGSNYLEITCDVTSSSIARGIFAMVYTYTKSVVIDLVFTIEPQSMEELPERIMLGVRFHKLDTELAPRLPLTPNPSARLEYAKQVQAAALAAGEFDNVDEEDEDGSLTSPTSAVSPSASSAASSP